MVSLDRTVYPEFEPAEATLLMDKLSDRVRELYYPAFGSETNLFDNKPSIIS